jgi:oligoendopeptidase F
MLVFLVLLSLASAGELPPWDPDPSAERDAIPDVYKWDLTTLYEDEAAWEADIEVARAQLKGLAEYRGTLADPAQLTTCLDLYFDIHESASRTLLYASLRGTTAATDPTAAAMEQRAQQLQTDLMDGASFIRVELLALTDEQLEKAYKKQPGLEAYRRYIEDIARRRDRVLSPDAEAVLAQLGDNLWAEVDLNELHSPPELAFQAMMADIQWPMVHDEAGNEVQLSVPLYGRLRASEDRTVRMEAADAVFGTLRTYQDVFAATLAGQDGLDVSYARARGYDTALEAYLDKDNLEVSVYENLVTTVNENLEPLHRYVSLRKRVLGVDELRFADMFPPIVEGVEREIPYPEARETILTALAPLGEDYVGLVAASTDPERGMIDVYPHDGKRSGAFSAATYRHHPYVMMNYQDSLEDMSTLAHEYGHWVHSYLSMRDNGYPDWTYPPFLAEIASTANEVLLMDTLLAKAETKEERIYLLATRADDIRFTIHRQTLFAEFEWEVHKAIEEGTPVTAKFLEETYAGLVQRYYGPDYVLGPNDGMEWAYIPHFYYKYYVYSYATGLSAGVAVAQRVKDGEPKAVEDYMSMLRGGSSMAPLELLRGAGVDLSSPEPIKAALKLFDETVTELEELLAEPPE